MNNQDKARAEEEDALKRKRQEEELNEIFEPSKKFKKKPPAELKRKAVPAGNCINFFGLKYINF